MILCGKYKNISIHQSFVNSNSAHVLRVSVEHAEGDNLKCNLNRILEIESQGIKENEWDEHNSFIKNTDSKLYFIGKRYVTRLSFKDDNEVLWDNFEHETQIVVIEK